MKYLKTYEDRNSEVVKLSGLLNDLNDHHFKHIKQDIEYIHDRELKEELFEDYYELITSIGDVKTFTWSIDDRLKLEQIKIMSRIAEHGYGFSLSKLITHKNQINQSDYNNIINSYNDYTDYTGQIYSKDFIKLIYDVAKYLSYDKFIIKYAHKIEGEKLGLL